MVNVKCEMLNSSNNQASNIKHLALEEASNIEHLTSKFIRR